MEEHMIVSPYKVYAVVDRRFGEKLAALPLGVPVWIVDTDINKPVIQRLWKERGTADHRTEITAFKNSGESSVEESLISQLEDIDLHHGVYSASPAYTILEVLGTPPSERIKSELCKFGFSDVHPGVDGFVAVRPLPPNPRE
jgi:hypothetical protein